MFVTRRVYLLAASRSLAKCDGLNRDNRATQPLQLELRHRLRYDATLNRRVDSLTKQDLAVTGRVAQPRGRMTTLPIAP
jgi:hypothetical protein